MPKTKELVPLKKLQIEEIFKDEKTCDKTLAQIKEYALTTKFDVTTAKGRAACISHAAAVSKSANAVDKKGLELTKGMRDKIGDINDIRKKVKEFLKPVAIEARAPVTAWEEAEELKKAKEAQRIRVIDRKIEFIKNFNPLDSHNFPIGVTKASVNSLEAAIDILNEMPIDKETYQEFQEAAQVIKNEKYEELHSALKFRKDQDKLAADQKKLDDEKAKVAAEKQKMEDEKTKVKAEKDRVEKQRAKNIEQKIQGIKDCSPGLPIHSTNHIDYLKTKLSKIIVDKSFGEREKEARLLRSEILVGLNDARPLAVKHDKEQAEKAEAKRRSEIKEEESAKQKVVDEKEEVKKADTEHRRKINRKVLDLFMSVNLSDEEEKIRIMTANEAIKILKAIVRSQNEFITVNY